jgi:hypothetical protein
MTIGNLSDVRHNFRAIYEAAHYNPTPFPNNPEEPPEKLYPVELYAYLSPWLLPFDGELNFKPWRQRLLHSDEFRYFMLEGSQRAINKTHELFHKWQTQFFHQDLPYMKTYLSEVSNLSSPQKVDEQLYKPTRDNIQDFYLSTHHFLHSIHHDPNVRMRQIFKEHFCQKCFDPMEPLEQMYAIMALQGEIGETLPLKVLIEASFEKEMEEVSLHNFIKKISARKVSFNILHSALKAIVEYALKSKITADDIERKHLPSLENLEYALYRLDPSLFSCPHPEHLEWRKTLKPGSEIVTIRYENKSGQQKATRYRFILGEQLGKKLGQFDHNIYFEIKECFVTPKIFTKETIDELKYEPLIKFHKESEEKNSDIEKKSVIWISANEAIPGIRSAMADLCYGIELSQIQFIDNQGRFALVEKLYDNHTEFVKLLPDWIQWALREVENAPISLEPLRYPQTFMFNKETELKAVKLVKRAESFSFNAWEQFIYEASKGDNPTFKTLMLKSQMASMAEAEFIRNTVLASFNQSQFDPQQPCKTSFFHDKNVLKLALDLQADMIKLHENSCRRLESEGRSPISKEKVQELLLKFYQDSGAFSVLWPTLQDKVLAAYKA